MIDKFVRRTIYDWCLRTFGQSVVHNTRERSLRLVEECIELAQVHEVDRDIVHRLVDAVYSRSVGHAEKEVGDVFICLVILCEASGYDMNWCIEEGIAKLLNTDPEKFRKRFAEKTAANLVG